MSIVPLKGRFESIPAMLAAIAEDPTVIGIAIAVLHDAPPGSEYQGLLKDGRQAIQATHLGMSRANMALASLMMGTIATEPEDGA